MLTRDWIEAAKKTPTFQTVNEDGVATLKATLADHFDALCDMALSSLSGGWRPISEAPKDGTHILTYTDQWKFGVLIEFWDIAIPAWREVYSHDVVRILPTHWKPLELPSPPQVSQEGE